MSGYDQEIEETIKAEEAKKRYKQMYERIVSAGFEQYIDECVDRENCQDEYGNFLTEKDGYVFWTKMTRSMVDSVGFRLEEIGICANDYGIPY